MFSIGPAITIKGRKFKGLRGWAGKPLHPPLTDIPVATYVLALVFDVISFLAGSGSGFARDAYVAGTWTIIAGVIVSLPTALTGFWDWLKSTPRGTQACAPPTGIWRSCSLSRHWWSWTSCFGLGADAAVVPTVVLVLSIVADALVMFGAAYGGSLVYDYGFNVETAGDHPVWHASERDVYPKDATSAEQQ